MHRRSTAAVLAAVVAAVAPVAAAVIDADPTDYRDKIATLQPGDTLRLQPGTYLRLSLSDLHGEPEARITITGPESGDPAVIEGESCCNTVQLRRTSYLTLENLVIDSLGLEAIDGINSQGGTSHDIVIENNTIRGVGGSQQTVGINTKGTAWNWVIRNNTILEPGTGLYLGDSNGSAPFIAGVIEGNLVKNATGYCMQIKHQVPYNLPDAPAGPNVTLIRNNVFLKDDRPSPSGNRPNLLVGPFPDSGHGSADRYEIYGNFLYHNHRESLIQASGRVAIHDNVLVDAGAGETAIFLTDHNGPLDLAYVYNNTIYGGAQGIRFASPAREDHWVIGNLVFAGDPIGGNLSQQRDNVTDSVANAVNHVAQPSTVLGEMDFYPLPGRAQGPALDYPAPLLEHRHYDQDFNATGKGAFTFRGAYAGEGGNPGWQLAGTRKAGGPGSSGDTTPPSIPTDVSASAVGDSAIELAWTPSSDTESGVSRYKVYRDGAPVAQPAGPPWTDTGLAEATTYSYRVSALNGAGLESEPSLPAAATTATDTTAPALESATAVGDPERVLVRFSEPVEQASAENPANYAIDNGIVVTTATLQDDPATVVLSTTAHAAGVTYTLTVNGVRDRAGAPNTIAADSRVGYVFQPQLVISNLVVLSGKAYRDLEGLADGATAYIDRAFTYSGVPAQLAGATYIQTANDDKQSQGDGFLEFDVNQAVTVYVAHDDRYATKPAWLAGYADSGDDLTIDVVFSLLQRDFAAGRISLGGNVNPAEPEGNSMYTVIVVPAENPIPDLPPDAPRRLRIKTD